MARFRDRNGRLVERSTGETDEAAAWIQAKEFEAVARGAARSGRLRDRIEELNREAAGISLACPSLREFSRLWMDTKRLSVRASTAAWYQKTLDGFLEWLGKDADAPMDRIQPEQVEAWRNEVAKVRAKKTANHRHKVLRMVFRQARLKGHISRDPAEAVATLRRDSTASPREAFTMDQVAAVLAACTDAEWRSLVLFGVYTGQRLKDLCLLRWQDVAGGVLSIATGKTGRRVRVPLAEPVVACLAKTKRAGKFVHPRAAGMVLGQAAQGSNTVARQFSEILAKAGLREKAKHRKGEGARRCEPLSFHSLRHTCVSLLHAANVSRAVAMEIAGHESTAVHQLYTHVGDAAMREAISKLPGVQAAS
jgi:integrase